jgi:hypothetical protein
LKKSICLVFFVFAAFSISLAADCAVVIASKGKVKAAAAGYETGALSSLAVLSGQARIDILESSKTGPIHCSPTAGLKLEKGRVWVRCEKSKAAIICSGVTAEGINSVFSASLAQIDVYSGFVTIKGGKKLTRLGRSMRYDIGSGKISNIGDTGSNDDGKQILMDKFDIYCTLDAQTKDYINIRNTFAGAFTAFYHAGKAFFSFDSPKENYDLNLDIKINTANSRYIFNGVIKNTISNDTVAIFSDDETQNETGMQGGFTKMAIEAGRAIQNYGSKVLNEGTKVFIEVQGNNTENANEIRKILEKTAGINGLKYSDSNGKNSIFEMQFTGNGYDLAGILEGRKVQNKSINIWKNSKFVVKLSII